MYVPPHPLDLGVRSWRRNTQHHGTPFNQSAPQMAGHTPSLVEAIEDGHGCHHAPHHGPSIHRHFLHHTTHMYNSRIFPFPRSASIIALNPASENLHLSSLDVRTSGPRRRLEHPQRLNAHPRATNLKSIPSFMAPTPILEDGCCGACLQQTPLHPRC